MNALLQHVRRTILRHALIPPESRLLVGLSGGSDSVALLFILRDLAESSGFTISGVAHLNHCLRRSADRDEAFCRGLADRLGLRILVENADVQGYASRQNLSVEDAARRIRYEFLDRAAEALQADRIAVGHTQDDQAETFLMKLMRGAGLTGLAGIYPQRDRVIRPLLDVSRLELRDELEARGEQWIEDETNDDLGNPRNRIRHEVLPQLDRAAGASTRPAIARAAGLIRDDGRWLDEMAEQRYRALAEEHADGVAFEAALAAAEPPAIRRRLLMKALRAGSGKHEIGLDHVEAAMAVLAGTCRGADIPGGRVELRRGKLVLVQQKPATK
jgi:tRNA(Ile)-lysidine synthase